MNNLLSLKRWSLAVLVGFVLAPGCNKSPKVLLASVKGKVTVDGQAVTSGQVSLIPVDATTGKEAPGPYAGKIESSGEYTIYTGGKEGAPLGRYKVTVTPPMLPSPDGKPPSAPFNRKFMESTKTTLTYEVVANAEAGRYDLKLTK
jgi:hypothetical protein